MDPTPGDPVALRMALADPASGPLAWIGRPCQYTMPEHGRSCRVEYWTTARYAPEVVDNLGDAIDILKRRSGAKRLVLIGYSGGGALVVLLAARRNDVMAVITVAANLDLGYWTKRDGLTPLSGSLDSADAASSLGKLPQIHFTGGQDKAVGTDVARSFMTRLPPGAPARLVEITQIRDGRGLERRQSWGGLALGVRVGTPEAATFLHRPTRNQECWTPASPG
jgi:pimeloyl-ACP methyl ester carboxylesterase